MWCYCLHVDKTTSPLGLPTVPIYTIGGKQYHVYTWCCLLTSYCNIFILPCRQILCSAACSLKKKIESKVQSISRIHVLYCCYIWKVYSTHSNRTFITTKEVDQKLENETLGTRKLLWFDSRMLLCYYSTICMNGWAKTLFVHCT